MRAKACFVLGVLAAAAAAGLAVLPLRGPDPMAVPTVQQVFERTMSPFCPGLTVAECPSLQAGDMRERIAERVAGRWSNRRIDRWLVENYG
ncbi:MAG: cytochrome c-type biogenesis protein, partial [Candidatus Methylomirabilales bacterium]